MADTSYFNEYFWRIAEDMSHIYIFCQTYARVGQLR
jgi:hypothetical protein